jgi:hypothetical protein
MAADWAFPAIVGPGPAGMPGPAPASETGLGAAARRLPHRNLGPIRRFSRGPGAPAALRHIYTPRPSAVPALVLHCGLN